MSKGDGRHRARGALERGYDAGSDAHGRRPSRVHEPEPPRPRRSTAGACRGWSAACAITCGEVEPPVVTLIAQQARDPFRVLISTMLSARTKDEVTAAASARLFAVADNAAAVAALPLRRLERLIFPVGFYRTKARNLKAACRILVERFDGRVPDSIDGPGRAARSRPQDRQPGVDRRVRQARDVRRHPRPPHLQSVGTGRDPHSRRRPRWRCAARCRGATGSTGTACW